VFGLMLLVNIFTEVLKKALWDKIPTNLLVFILSVIITVVAMFIYLQIANIAFVWWMLCIAIMIAFFVAYSAMFGFDKWKQMFDQWKQLR
jgi:hypothetical protein